MLASSRAYASGARWKLMNPAPATSVRESRGLAGSAATMAAASSRGLRRAALASRSARLVVNSPCPLSRVRSTTTAGGAGISVSTLPVSLAREASSSCSSSCFNREIRAFGRRASVPEAPTVDRGSEQLDRIHIQRPAHRARALELLDLRQPGIEEFVQARALRALHQQLRVVASGALVHRRRHRAEQPHPARRLLRELAGLGEEAERGLRGGGGVAQRRQAAERRPGRLGALGERRARKAVVAFREQAGE